MLNYLFYQHLGLGDHLISNGLIRHICKTGQSSNQEVNHNFFIVSKPTTFESVQFMFRDVINLKVIKLHSGNFSNSEDTQEVYRIAALNNARIIKIGHEYLDYSISYDESFYKQFGLQLHDRWHGFKVIRDFKKEKSLFDSFKIDSDYIFLHEDIERNMLITKGLPENIKIIRADQGVTNNIFDYLSIIEGAKEIHVVESCFLHLVESFDFNGKLFRHRYTRNYPKNCEPHLIRNWNTIY